MAKLTKNRKLAEGKIEPEKQYKLSEAAQLVKEITTTKFDASVDIDVRLGIDPKKANQMVRGVVTLPHGTGKQIRVLVLCTPDKEEEARTAGAEFIGLDDYVEKIQNGWTDVDVIITMPSVMGKIGKLDFKVDKSGIVHTSIGKASFTADKIAENAREFIHMLMKLKPSSAKGSYICSIFLSTTMSPGIKVDAKAFDE
jgi:large subunit ribosomal protein L1